MNKFISYLKNNSSEFDTIGSVDENAIAKAEESLALKFCVDYKELVSNFGCIGFGSYEIYGLGVPTESHLNVVDATLNHRKLGLKDGFIVISELEDGLSLVLNDKCEIYDYFFGTNKMKYRCSLTEYLSDLILI